jgi:hypothetical protein
MHAHLLKAIIPKEKTKIMDTYSMVFWIRDFTFREAVEAGDQKIT